MAQRYKGRFGSLINHPVSIDNNWGPEININGADNEILLFVGLKIAYR